MNSQKLLKFSLTILVISILIFIRFLFLDADPSFMKRIGDLQDEGYWTHNARMKVLFDTWVPDDMSHAVVFSPLYTGLMYVSFKMRGVNVYNARLVSAIFSIATLLLLYFLLRSSLGKQSASLATLILASNYTYLIYNRLALVETTLSFFLLFSLACWYWSYKRPWMNLLSGFFFSLAILIKITAIYFAPIFLLLWLKDYHTKKFRLSSFLMFNSTAFLPIFLYAFFVFIPNLPLYKVNLLNSLSFSHKTGVDIIAGFFRILTNNFFGELSVFILFSIFFMFLIFMLNCLLECTMLSTRSLTGGANRDSFPFSAEKLGFSCTQKEPPRAERASHWSTKKLRLLVRKWDSFPTLRLTGGGRFLFEKDKDHNDQPQYSATSPNIVSIAVCWILGGIIGMPFSNMHDRRFLMFLIPFSIIASYAITYCQSLEPISVRSLSEKIYQAVTQRRLARLTLSLFFVYPIFSLLYVFINIQYKLNFSNFKVNLFLIIAFLLTSIITYCGLAFLMQKSPLFFQQKIKYFFIDSCLILFLLPLFALTKNYTNNFLIMSGKQSSAAITIALFLFISCLVFLGFHYCLGKREDIRLNPKIWKKMMVTYFSINIVFILITFLSLSFTLANASWSIGQYVPSGATLAGSSVNLLSLETRAKPIFYNPLDPDYAILNNNTKSSHQYLLITTCYDGHHIPEKDLLTHQYQKVTFIKEFSLYPYPNGQHRQIMQLYKVDKP